MPLPPEAYKVVRDELGKRKKRHRDGKRDVRARANREWQKDREGVLESESDAYLSDVERKRLWRRERRDLARIRSYRKRGGR